MGGHKVKHFEIIYFIGNHAFEFKCTTAREAYDALMDIGDNDPSTHIAERADQFMEDIVEMKNGHKLSVSTNKFTIRIADGEV
jgi:hypothetical protein